MRPPCGGPSICWRRSRPVQKPRRTPLADSRRALLAADRFSVAEGVLRRAVERLPVQARAFRDLATVAARLGRMETARAATLRFTALTREPRHQAPARRGHEADSPDAASLDQCAA